MVTTDKNRPSRMSRLLGLANRRWRQTIDQRLASCEVTEAGLAPLIQLAGAEQPIRQKDLAASLALETSSLVRILARLQANGLIVSLPDPQDGRAKALSATPAGAALADRALSISLELEQEVLAGIDEERIQITREVLQHILDRLEPK